MRYPHSLLAQLVFGEGWEGAEVLLLERGVEQSPAVVVALALVVLEVGTKMSGCEVRT